MDGVAHALVLRALTVERLRQEKAIAALEIPHSLSSLWCPPAWKVAVLGEEFGEVCRAVLEAKGRSVMVATEPRLKEELVQLAACAVAWLEEPVDCGPKERYYGGAARASKA